MDARIAKTHHAVMTAAGDLLVEQGPDGLTVDAVVARSGVAKSTVYRHWATRDELVAAVFADCAPDLSVPDESLPFEAALRALAHSFLDMLNDEHWRRMLPALLLLKFQMGQIAELDGEMKEQQQHVIRSVLQRGVDEGRISPQVLDDLDATIALLIGPIVMVTLTDLVALDGAFTDRVVSQFLAYHATDGAPTSKVGRPGG
ncbi:MAG: TetR/AcrR family transcriptional regulator [Microthrixaceae bacterium]